MVDQLITRYVVLDTRSALHDGMNAALCLFDNVVVSGLPGIRHALEDIDHYNPVLNERPRNRPEVIRRLLLEGLYREGSAPLTEEQIRSFFQESEYLISHGAMVEPPVDNVWWQAALNFDEERFRNSLALKRSGVANSEIFTARSEVDYTAVPGEFSKADVIQYVLRQVPVPRADVPLQELLAFRAEQANRAKLSMLRTWITEQATKSKSLADLDDRFVVAFNEYKSAIALLDSKYRTTSLGLVVSVGAEVVDNLLRLKLGTAVKAIFDWRKARIEREAEEAKAPGKELALLFALERAFAGVRQAEGSDGDR